MTSAQDIEVSAGGVSTAPAAPHDLAVLLRWHVSAKVVTEGILAALLLLAAAATGDAPLVALATPVAVAAVLGLTRRRPELLSVTLSATPLVSGPDEDIAVVVHVSARASCICRIAVALPAALESKGPSSWTLLVRPGHPESLTCTVRARRPGRFPIGPLGLAVSDPTVSVVGKSSLASSLVVESRPAPLSVRNLVRAERVRATAGDRVARLAADGIEFAEVREETAGALERRVNWRATARRGATCVNVHHPERSTDVVLLVDTFTEAVLPDVVAVSVSLADAYVRRHDRVGLVAFGGILDWVEPGTGPTHLERMRRCLLSSEAYFSYAWKTAEVIPRRLFPAGCLVLAVSPLGDPRFISTLASIRSRNIDLAVVEVEPAWEATEPTRRTVALARRIVAMEREEVRRSFFRIGVPVTTLEGPKGVAGGLAELAAFRRAARGRVGIGRGPGGRR